MGDDCDVGLALKLNTSSGSCASRVELRLDDRCADETESCFRFLDLTGPLHLGGLLSSVTSHTAVSHLSQHFTGCLRDVSIDGRIVDLDDYVWNNGTEAGCAIKRPSCASSPCRNGGTCEESWGSYRCSCLERWGGKDCSQGMQQLIANFLSLISSLHSFSILLNCI
jgi:cadherin EGF LAG seven-pass G-type receptor 1